MTSQTTKAAMAQVFAQHAAYASLHTADPGSTGANQAGTRLPVSWSATTDGLVSDEMSFPTDIATYTHVGLWSTASGGEFVGAVANQAEFTVDGSTYKVTLNYSYPQGS